MNDIDYYLKQISDGLNEPIEIVLVEDGGDYEGEFKIGEVIFNINIININTGVFLYTFTSNNTYNLGNDIKGLFSIISTIQNNVKKFIISHKPRLFIFVKTDNSKIRDRFYSEFLENISIQFGYDYDIQKFESFTLYVMSNYERLD